MPYTIRRIHPSALGYSGADGTSDYSDDAHEFRLWPYQSLPQTGFAWFIGATAAQISLPLLTVLGSPIWWGLLPFLGLAIAGIWWALQRNRLDGKIDETLTVYSDHMTLLRDGPHGKHAKWEANPYWVTAVLHPTGGPVQNYLTLRGGDREVELGAFLSEPERIALHLEIVKILKHLH